MDERTNSTYEVRLRAVIAVLRGRSMADVADASGTVPTKSASHLLKMVSLRPNINRTPEPSTRQLPPKSSMLMPMAQPTPFARRP
jgi:hypothetical protein